jgi:hypothetical protein
MTLAPRGRMRPVYVGQLTQQPRHGEREKCECQPDEGDRTDESLHQFLPDPNATVVQVVDATATGCASNAPRRATPRRAIRRPCEDSLSQQD